MNIPADMNMLMLKDKWYDFYAWYIDNVWRKTPRFVRRFYRVMNDWWYEQVACRLFPKQAWLTKAAGRTWRDKPGLIEDVLYASIVHFVEEEKCFEHPGWQEKEMADISRQLKEVYDWIKQGRPKTVEEIRKAFNSLEIPYDFDELIRWLNSTDPKQNAVFEEVRRLENELQQWDDRCLPWIVYNRSYLSI